MKTKRFTFSQGFALFVMIYLMLMLLFSHYAKAQDMATREDGRKVILYKDYTWKFADTQQKQSDPQKQSLPTKPSYQCEGKTKAGNQCKHMVTDSIHYCYQHRSQINFKGSVAYSK